MNQFYELKVDDKGKVQVTRQSQKEKPQQWFWPVIGLTGGLIVVGVVVYFRKKVKGKVRNEQ